MTEPTKNICKGKKWSTADVLKYSKKNISKVNINRIEAKCQNDCLTCRRSTCRDVRPVPGEPRPEEAEATTSRVEQLENTLRFCKRVIKEHATDTIWASGAQTLVELIDEVIANNDQGDLFEKI
jgi:hypothetical protein